MGKRRAGYSGARCSLPSLSNCHTKDRRTGNEDFGFLDSYSLELAGISMAQTQFRFDDGAAYERYMGDWSRRAGTVFLDWLAAPSGLKWIDVGCGNGAFTELLVEKCAPTEVHGIDPSEAQLDFARKRPVARFAKFDSGDAMALPFPAK